MYFVNRGNSNFLLLAIVILGFFFLISFLPYILLVGAVIWAISYGYKKLKQWNSTNNHKEKMKKNTFSESESQQENFNNENVIDVEYTEVK
jgi:predicted membrane protein